MANGGRSNTTMAFIVGGLVVAVAVLAYFIFGNGAPEMAGGGDSTSVTVETDGGSGGGSDEGGSGGGGDSGGNGGSGEQQGN